VIQIPERRIERARRDGATGTTEAKEAPADQKQIEEPED